VVSLGLSAQHFLIINEDTSQLQYTDSLLRKDRLEQLLFKKIMSGHVYATWKTENTNGHTYYTLDAGPKYNWGDHSLDNLTKSVQYWSSQGYPFASYSLESFKIIDDTIQAQWRLDKGIAIKNDTVAQIHDPKVKPKFLWKIIGMPPGEYYSEQKFNNIEKKFENYNALRLVSPPQIAFYEGKAKVYLDLEETAGNAFEGILGLQPSPSGTGSVLTGYLDIGLHNPFGTGKSLDFTWHRFNPQAQNLQAHYLHPFLFGSELHLDAGLSLLRQDSAFFSNQYYVGFKRMLSPALIIGIDIGRAASNQLNDSTGLEGVARFETNWFTLKFSNQLMNIRQISHQNFFDYEGSFSLGQKIVEEEELLNFRARGILSGQKVLGRYAALFGSLEGGVITSRKVFINEVFRLGGLKSLRGYNENQFFFKRYLVQQLEYRYFFERRSHLLAFIDGAWAPLDIHRIVYGYGLGLRLSTENGSFQFIFAQPNNEGPFFSNVRVHFGYTSVF
jgi:outer membrane translocation and assembly module TamA